MTCERRLLISLGDIKSISYECKFCGARISVSPDEAVIAPDRCVQCKKDWQSDDFVPQGAPTSRSLMEAALPWHFKLVRAICDGRNQEITKAAGFRILLEFEEPLTQSASQTSTQAR
jgi:hypothetical protein